MPSFTLLLLLVGAFLLGAVPFGYLAGRLRGIDLRTAGSGNIGATNTLRVLGPAMGTAVLLLDVMKGLVPVLVAARLSHGSDGGAANGWPVVGAGLAAVLGHTYSPFLRFRGGKGVATSLGVLIGLSPLVAGLALALFLVVVALTRYVSLGSLLAAVLQAFLFWLPLFHGHPAPWSYRLFGLLAAVFVIVRHRGNISRLLAGTESRFGKHPATAAAAAAAAEPVGGSAQP